MRNEKPTPRRRSPTESSNTDSTAPVSGSQFRRNQTLSSYRHATPEESSRRKAHHLALQRRRLGGILAIVAIGSVFLTLLLWQLIGQVHVTTSTKQLAASFSASEYEGAINRYLALNPAQRLRFTLDEAALSTYVTSLLPEVEKVAVSGSPGFGQANFSITFRTPVAGWQIDGKQWYVDAHGVVFGQNYYLAPSVQIVDESGIAPEQGATVASGRLLGFLGRVVAQAGERGYDVTQAILPADTTRRVDIYVKDVSPRIRFSIDRGAGEQVEDMDRVLKFLDSRGLRPAYVDVRVSGKAVYQ